MAKQGQKFNSHPKEFRIKMIQELETNSINKVSKGFNVNKSTLNSWKTNLEKNKLNIKKEPKKAKIKDLEYYKVRYEILKKLQDLHKQNKKKYNL